MIDIVGLGPGELDRTSGSARKLLVDPSRRVIMRTMWHPAAAELADLRPVEDCDDLYETLEHFDQVYRAIADRVLAAAVAGEAVVYAVPGSPLIGEFAVAEIRRLAEDRGMAVSVHPAESFLDAMCAELGIDPLRHGLQVLDGHDLPVPLVVDKPTIIGHLDRAEVLADVGARLDRVLPEDTLVAVVVGAGAPDVNVVTSAAAAVDPSLAGVRTSLYVPGEPGGLVGAIHAMRRLREECPWDREQTHQSLVRYLVEETHELAEAIAALPLGGEPDWVAYAAVEDELGDVLLQVLFHAEIARRAGAMDIDDVGERLRRKLVRRHPHVFGDVVVEDAAEVKQNWDRIKREEGNAGSAVSSIPVGLPALARAADVQRKAADVGLDWPDTAGVVAKLREEIDELEVDLGDPARSAHELGDVLFTAVNLARHLGVDAELVLRAAVARFEQRFRTMEEMGPFEGLSATELDARWERAKQG